MPAFLGIALISRVFVWLFGIVYSFLTGKVVRRYLFFAASVATTMALFAGLWVTINLFLSVLQVSLPSSFMRLIPIILPSTADEYLAAYFAIKAAISILVYNAKLVKQMSLF